MLSNPNDPRSSSAHATRKRRVGLSIYHEDRLKEQLRTQVPSEPWMEAQFKSVNDVDADGQPIVYRFHDPHVFPPGGEQTLMIRCPECGIFNPPNAIEHGSCLDHAPNRGWGPSPSAVAIRALQMLNIRLIDLIQLQPDDTRSLRDEISQFRRKKRRKKRRKNSSKSRRRKS